MATERSIAELVKLAAAGDDAAVSELYEKTSNHAYYLALQLVKDEDESQDILEDSFIKALGSIGSLQDPSKFQGWLNSIVVNASKDYLKKKKPVLFSQLSTGDEGDEAVDFVDESEQFSPEATVDYNETKRLVKEMIDNLPEEQRLAIILHYMEDYSVKDIAQMMECSEGTVKSRLNYGRKQIEKDVLDLEKKGTKLYCAPLVPFLFWMFHTPAPASVISTAAPVSMAAGTAAGSTVGATVTTGTAAGSTVGATVTTGTAAGSTVGATVSTETASSTVGASVAADAAEAAASTVGASVTAGTAAGSTVGATVTTGAAASTAGAAVTTGAATAAGAASGSTAAGTAAAATGLSLAAKIGIVAAVVVIGGGAAVGVTAVSRSNERQATTETVIQTEDEVYETEGSLPEIIETMPEEPEEIVLAAEPLTEEQISIITGTILPTLIYDLYMGGEYHYGGDRFDEDDFTTDFMINYLYGILNHTYEGYPLAPYVGLHYIPDPEYPEFTREAFDMDSSLKVVSDILGQTLTEEDLIAVNDEYMRNHGWPFINIIGNDLTGIGADGEGWVTPVIDAYAIDGDRIALSLPFRVEFNSDELNDTGHATAIFVVNPDSFFGYSLESLAIGQTGYDLYNNVLNAGPDVVSGGIQIASVTASSTLTDGGTTYSPELMIDGDLSTAWSEGVSGNGEGESVTFNFAEPTVVSGIIFNGGYLKDFDLYYRNSRPSRIRVSTSDGSSTVFELFDAMGSQQFTLPQPVETESLTITIESVYPGTAHDDTLISEVTIF